MVKTFILQFLMIILIPSYAFAQWTLYDENLFNLEKYNFEYNNKSTLSCGSSSYLEVYSSFDILAILSISNAISSEQINMETNWGSFRPSISSAEFSEDYFKLLPQDMRRILFLCLTWNESERLKLFVVPEVALENIAQRLKHERPWQKMEPNFVKKMDFLSPETLKRFVYLVLRANVFESVRGDLLNNKSLWFIPWTWLTPNTGLYE